MADVPKSCTDLVDEVELFLAPAAEQEAWARTQRVPSEEIALQFYDGVGAFVPYLREHHFLDAVDERALRELDEYVKAAQTRLFSTARSFATLQSGYESESLRQGRRHRCADHSTRRTHSGR